MKARTGLLILRAALTKRLPLYVQFAVSNRCNLRCRMCNALPSRSNEKELSLSEIERLSTILKRLNVAILVLTGGEPLIRKDLSEIVRIFSGKGLEVRLQTNGILANERRLLELKEAGLSGITISLDSLDSKKQDNINSNSGTWDKMVNTIAAISKIFLPQNSICGINTVVSRLNIEEIPGIIKFASKIGFYSSLIPVHLAETKQDFIVRSKDKSFGFRKDDHAIIDRIYAQVVEMKKKGFNIYNSFRFLKESSDFLKYRKMHWRCDSPYLYFAISPEGNFLPCVDITTRISMLNGDFVGLYGSGDFRSQIRKIVDSCSGCMYACWPEMSYLCRDPFVFFERVLQGIKIFYTREKITPTRTESLLKIIEDIKNEKDR